MGQIRSTFAIALAVVFGFSLTVPMKAAEANPSKESFKRPLYIPFPAKSPYSPQMATLGKMLFFDPRLSGAKNMTCASCHNPSFGYETPVPTAIGAANTPLGRHAPTIINAAWVEPLFWDGRAPDLESQAAGPITAGVEMNGKFDVIISDLSEIAEYERWFGTLFPGSGITRENILTAIATYERMVVSGWAPFDRWVDGDDDAISEEAKRGFDLFVGKASCVNCHTGWNFTDNAFHDIGLETEDPGRFAIAPDEAKSMHAFKTPGLRNTTYRAPFMHHGKMATLEEVITHYMTGGIQRPSLSDKMVSFSLSNQEYGDLVAFVKSLTAEQSDPSIPILPN